MDDLILDQLRGKIANVDKQALLDRLKNIKNNVRPVDDLFWLDDGNDFNTQDLFAELNMIDLGNNMLMDQDGDILDADLFIRAVSKAVKTGTKATTKVVSKTASTASKTASTATKAVTSTATKAASSAAALAAKGGSAVWSGAAKATASMSKNAPVMGKAVAKNGVKAAKYVVTKADKVVD